MAKRKKSDLTEEEKRPLNKASLRNLKSIARFMLPYKGIFSIGLVSLLLSSFTLMAFPRLSGELLDIASGKAHYFTTIHEAGLAMIDLCINAANKGMASFARLRQTMS